MYQENSRFRDLLLPNEKSRLVASVMPQSLYQRLIDQAVTRRMSVSRMLRLFTEEMLTQLEGPLTRDAVKGPTKDRRLPKKPRLKPRPTRKVPR